MRFSNKLEGLDFAPFSEKVEVRTIGLHHYCVKLKNISLQDWFFCLSSV